MGEILIQLQPTIYLFFDLLKGMDINLNLN